MTARLSVSKYPGQGSGRFQGFMLRSMLHAHAVLGRGKSEELAYLKSEAGNLPHHIDPTQPIQNAQ